MHDTVRSTAVFPFNEKHYNGVATSVINLKKTNCKVSVNILSTDIALWSIRERLQLDQYKTTIKPKSAPTALNKIEIPDKMKYFEGRG